MFRGATMRTADFVMLSLLLGGSVPIAADTYPRQPGVDGENYRFELSLSDETDEIVGRTTVSVRYLAGGVESLALDLVGKASPDAVDGMEVDGVRWLGADEKASYRFESDQRQAGHRLHHR
jgi:hypothetical protein